MTRGPSAAQVAEHVDLAWIRASVYAGKCLACGAAIPNRDFYAGFAWMRQHLADQENWRRLTGKFPPPVNFPVPEAD